MTVQYLHLMPESSLPDISDLAPFCSVVVIEAEVTIEWQKLVSKWLVKSGCLYMMAWGKDCSSWDDSVDYANLEEFDYNDIPDDKFVMTTWHENEPLNEVFWFSKYNASHDSVEISNILILHISEINREKALLSEYDSI